jgi:hypothetical protein
MKYLCLVYLDAERWSACSDLECADYVQQLLSGRRLLAAEPLHRTHTATTVRVRGGEVTLFDGPFAETREMLAGFYLIDAKDLNEATQLDRMHSAGALRQCRGPAGARIAGASRPVTRGARPRCGDMHERQRHSG